MTKGCYDILIQRKDIDVIQRACRNRPALIAYESMPERFKAAIESKLGDVYQYVKENELLKHIQEDQKTVAFFRDYRFGDDRSLHEETQCEYYANVKVIYTMNEVVNIWRQMRKNWERKVWRMYGKILPNR